MIDLKNRKCYLKTNTLLLIYLSFISLARHNYFTHRTHVLFNVEPYYRGGDHIETSELTLSFFAHARGYS